MPYSFNGNQTHSLGVEIELQIVDAESLALSNAVQQILDRVPEKWSNKIKPELMQSYCEFNTDVCSAVKDVKPDLVEKLQWGRSVAQELGLKFVWGGTHAFSPWYEQEYTRAIGTSGSPMSCRTSADVLLRSACTSTSG